LCRWESAARLPRKRRAETPRVPSQRDAYRAPFAPLDTLERSTFFSKQRAGALENPLPAVRWTEAREQPRVVAARERYEPAEKSAAPCIALPTTASTPSVASAGLAFEPHWPPLDGVRPPIDSTKRDESRAAVVPRYFSSSGGQFMSFFLTGSQ